MLGGECHQVRLRGADLFVLTGCAEPATSVFATLPAVARVVAGRRAFELCDRELWPGGTVVDVAGVPIGDGGVVLAAGPCAVETATQLDVAATAAAGAGAALLRGGAFKPRSSPYSFQGLGVPALELLAEQRRRTGLRVVTEVLEPEQVGPASALADMLQIGTRSMHNFALLREVGRAGLPVLLKRGMAATVEEWLLAAEYVLAAGNADVVLCERGIRTFEPATRFTLDLAVIPLVKQLSHLPVFVDPSHATGHAHLVPAMTLAAAAAGADGVLLDIHHDPRSARCDGGQALQPGDLTALADALARQLAATGRTVTPAPVPSSLRTG
jgi:3-deoxy-7-phosphoheptulonate synthase